MDDVLLTEDELEFDVALTKEDNNDNVGLMLFIDVDLSEDAETVMFVEAGLFVVVAGTTTGAMTDVTGLGVTTADTTADVTGLGVTTADTKADVTGLGVTTADTTAGVTGLDVTAAGILATGAAAGLGVVVGLIVTTWAALKTLPSIVPIKPLAPKGMSSINLALSRAKLFVSSTELKYFLLEACILKTN